METALPDLMQEAPRAPRGSGAHPGETLPKDGEAEIPLPDLSERFRGKRRGGNGTEFPVGLPNSGTENESTAAYGAWAGRGGNLDLGSLGPSSTPLPYTVVEHSCRE